MKIIRLLKIIGLVIPFLLICLRNGKVALTKKERYKQFILPFVALIYCFVALYFIDRINLFLLKVYSFIVHLIIQYIPFLSFLNRINISSYMIYISNFLLVSIFIIIKRIILFIVRRAWKSDSLIESTSGFFYEKDDKDGMWFVRPECDYIRKYYSYFLVGIYVTTNIIFVCSQFYKSSALFAVPFYPVTAILIFSEVYNFLNGVTSIEYNKDIYGEDEEAFHISNYAMLREIYRKLFDSFILYDGMLHNAGEIDSNFQTIEEMLNSEDRITNTLGEYFNNLKIGGHDIKSSFVKSSVQLFNGKSTLFYNPFYRDLTDYMILPVLDHLLKYEKCLIIVGRNSSTEDVTEWIRDSINQISFTDTLWKTGLLTEESSNLDIGVLQFSDLYNQKIQNNNADFLSKVGFVFFVEPSRMLATGQLGISLLLNRFDEKKKVVYCICDRNADGLVDTLSHLLKTDITEVAATLSGDIAASVVYWKADSKYMHHNIFHNISRYLGMGTEINSTAIRYQVSHTNWISSEKFPVVDMKWFAGQYYKTICDYANIPSSQQAFNDAFGVNANLWDTGVNSKSFLVVEDEFQNLFEMTRLFSSRSKTDIFVNVISENYLLRDYMIDNVRIFVNDPKAIPTIVTDFARTERNVILKLIIMMMNDYVCEDTIAQELMLANITFDNVINKVKELIEKHTNVVDPILPVKFKEVGIENGLAYVVKKYYTIEENSDLAHFADRLRNAYYITEDEKGESYYIGSRLYGHVFQEMLPGQFLTISGKYYQVDTITPYNGVVVKRAADHINGRKYYKQIHDIHLSNIVVDNAMGAVKKVNDIEITHAFADINIDTLGYVEMDAYCDLNTGKHITINGIPKRSYKNKNILKIKFKDISDENRYTICSVLNEVFRTVYPDSYPYISITTQLNNMSKEDTECHIHTLTCDVDDDCIYVIEDSEIDLGLLISIERNLERLLTIVMDYLRWHNEKSIVVEEPEVDTVVMPVLSDEPEEEKPGFFKRIWQKLFGKKNSDGTKEPGFFKKLWMKLFGKKSKKKPDDEPVIVENPEEAEVPSNPDSSDKSLVTNDDFDDTDEVSVDNDELSESEVSNSLDDNDSSDTEESEWPNISDGFNSDSEEEKTVWSDDTDEINVDGDNQTVESSDGLGNFSTDNMTETTDSENIDIEEDEDGEWY